MTVKDQKNRLNNQSWCDHIQLWHCKNSRNIILKSILPIEYNTIDINE